jgi:hypothetical protein
MSHTRRDSFSIWVRDLANSEPNVSESSNKSWVSAGIPTVDSPNRDEVFEEDRLLPSFGN